MPQDSCPLPLRLSIPTVSILVSSNTRFSHRLYPHEHPPCGVNSGSNLMFSKQHMHIYASLSIERVGCHGQHGPLVREMMLVADTDIVTVVVVTQYACVMNFWWWRRSFASVWLPDVSMKSHSHTHRHTNTQIQTNRQTHRHMQNGSATTTMTTTETRFPPPP